MKPLQVNPKFIVSVLRNCGYDNYTAIADIVDNSIEPEVGATSVNIVLEREKMTDRAGYTTKSISIVDDGSGMDKETLDEAMSLGAETGKTGDSNLGRYGTGLKSAALALGKKFEVTTKTENGKFYYTSFSIENDDVEISDVIELEEGTPQVMDFRMQISVDHGTIVKISCLDKLSNKDFNSFRTHVKDSIGVYFNKYIENKVVDFYCNGEPIEAVDLMWEDNEKRIVIEKEECEVNGHNVRYNAYYLPAGAQDSKQEREDATTDTRSSFRTRSTTKAGLYIYRQNRLVGYGLTFNLYSKDGHNQGFRCEIFVDGNCDELFGSTFNKLVNEKYGKNLDPEMLDFLKKKILPLKGQAEKRQKMEDDSNQETPIKEMEKGLNKIKDQQNSNKMLKVNRNFGINKKRDEEPKEREPRGPQKNPNPTRKRDDGWLGEFRLTKFGNSVDMFDVRIENNKAHVYINTDHAFFKEFFSQLPEKLRGECARVLSCVFSAKQQVNYYENEDIRKYLDMYYEAYGSEVNKSMNFVS